MIERETVVGQAKLHARPAVDPVSLARRFMWQVRLRKDGSPGNAKSAMDMLALGAVKDDALEALIAGTDEEGAAAVSAFAAGGGSP